MKRFVFHPRTQVVFGEGALESTSEYLDFADRFLVVTGRGSAVRHGHLERLLSFLGGKVGAVYSEVSANPRISEVEEAAEFGRKEGCQAVVGLGGGSAMDAAKGVAVAIAGDEEIETIFAKDIAAPATTLPIVAIPTTAGTGSETSRAAILTDEKRGIKKGLRGDKLLPAVAVVDPELTYTVPRKITAETGFDIFSHAVETWVSRKSNMLTAMYSREAIRRVVRWLPVVLDEPGRAEARRELMFASMLMGMNLAHSSTCLPHRLQYPVGARTDTSHPAGLAAIYPAWCEQTWPHAEEVFSEIVSICKPGTAAAGEAPRVVEDFLARIELVDSLTNLGVTEEMCRSMVCEVSGSLDNDPGNTSSEALLRIYLASLNRNSKTIPPPCKQFS